MSYQQACAVADAILFEGYSLYPYRASAPKNRFRWTFGTLAPQVWTERGGCEASWLETEVLVEPTAATRVTGRLRFLQMRERRVEKWADDRFVPVEALDLDERRVVAWQEGDLRERDLDDLEQGDQRLLFEYGASLEMEMLRDREGVLRGRVTQERWPVRGLVQTSWRRLALERPLARLKIRVENVSACEAPAAARDEGLHSSLLSAHLVLSVSGGEFISLLDPPDWAKEAAAACRSTRCHPALTGKVGARDALLVSPIILYDHPQVAPESPGDLFDATEIDEILMLRTAALTDDEKRECRATDPRIARLIDRVDQTPPEVMTRLHGALRGRQNGEMIPRPEAGSQVLLGARVRLRPGIRRTDAQDLLFAGRIATVEAVKEDVDGRECFAVTIDSDPAAELHRWYGRFHYYYRDEVELLRPGEET